MKQLIEEIKTLVSEEVERANKKNGPIKGTHEAYGLLKEEIEEMRDEDKDMRIYLGKLWQSVKEDSLYDISVYANTIEEAAILCAAEAIQVACVARRTERMADKKLEQILEER